METKPDIYTIKERVRDGMKRYLATFKDMFNGSIYNDASTSIIPWKTLKLGEEMQQKYLVAYEPSVCKTLEGYPDHYSRCLWLSLKTYNETTKWYERYSELQVDLMVVSGRVNKICMIVRYGKVANSLYPYKTTYTLRDDGELFVSRSRMPDHENSNGSAQYFDTNDPNGMGSLDLAILILGNSELISTELLNGLRTKELRHKQQVAQAENEKNAEINRYACLLNQIDI